MNLKERARKLKLELPTIFLSLKDKDTPIPAKILAAITIAYALSPIDLIPDFIPVLGYLDDIILLPLLVAMTIKFIPKKILEKNRQLAKGMWENGKPKKLYYAIPVLLIWLIIIWVIIKLIFL